MWNSMHLPVHRKNHQSVSTLQEELNNFFDQFSSDLIPETRDSNIFNPRVEVKETSKNIMVSAELPGLKESDITVSLQDNNLIIEGEKKQESEEKGKEYYRSEFSYGCFYRAIPLGEEVKEDSVEATYKDGILSVSVEKSKEASSKSKKIPISWGKAPQNAKKH